MSNFQNWLNLRNGILPCNQQNYQTALNQLNYFYTQHQAVSYDYQQFRSYVKQQGQQLKNMEVQPFIADKNPIDVSILTIIYYQLNIMVRSSYDKYIGKNNEKDVFWIKLKELLKFLINMKQNNGSISQSQKQIIKTLTEQLKMGKVYDVNNQIKCSQNSFLSDLFQPFMIEFRKFEQVEKKIRNLCGNEFLKTQYYQIHQTSSKCLYGLDYLQSTYALDKIDNQRVQHQVELVDKHQNSFKNLSSFQADIQITLAILSRLYPRKIQFQNIQNYSKIQKCRYLSEKIESIIVTKANQLKNLNLRNPKQNETHQVNIEYVFNEFQLYGWQMMKSFQTDLQTNYVKQYESDLKRKIQKQFSMDKAQFKRNYSRMMRQKNMKEMNTMENIVTCVLTSLARIYDISQQTDILTYIDQQNGQLNFYLKECLKERKCSQNLQQKISQLQVDNQKLIQKLKKNQQVLMNKQTEIDQLKIKNELLNEQQLKQGMISPDQTNLKLINQALNQECQKEKRKVSEIEKLLIAKQNEVKKFVEQFPELFNNIHSSTPSLSDLSVKMKDTFKRLQNLDSFLQSTCESIQKSSLGRKRVKQQSIVTDMGENQKQKYISDVLGLSQFEKYPHLKGNQILSISFQSQCFIKEQNELLILGEISNIFDKDSIDRVNLIYKSNSKAEPMLNQLPNTLLIIQTESGHNLAAYNSISYCQSVDMQNPNAFIVSSFSNKIFSVKDDRRGGEIENDYINFSNGCLKVQKKLKSDKNLLISNFDCLEFKEKVEQNNSVLTGVLGANEVNITKYQIYQIIFKNQKLKKIEKKQEKSNRKVPKQGDESKKQKQKIEKLQRELKQAKKIMKALHQKYQKGTNPNKNDSLLDSNANQYNQQLTKIQGLEKDLQQKHQQISILKQRIEQLSISNTQKHQTQEQPLKVNDIQQTANLNNILKQQGSGCLYKQEVRKLKDIENVVNMIVCQVEFSKDEVTQNKKLQQIEKQVLEKSNQILMLQRKCQEVRQNICKLQEDLHQKQLQASHIQLQSQQVTNQIQIHQEQLQRVKEQQAQYVQSQSQILQKLTKQVTQLQQNKKRLQQEVEQQQLDGEQKLRELQKEIKDYQNRKVESQKQIQVGIEKIQKLEIDYVKKKKELQEEISKLKDQKQKQKIANVQIKNKQVKDNETENQKKQIKVVELERAFQKQKKQLIENFTKDNKQLEKQIKVLQKQVTQLVQHNKKLEVAKQNEQTNEAKRKNLGIDKSKFFNGEIIQMDEDRNFIIRQIELQNQNSTVVKTKLLFSFPLMKGLDLHPYIDNIPHYIVIIKIKDTTMNGEQPIIALYSQKLLAKQQTLNKGKGFISSVTNRQSFYLRKAELHNPRLTEYNEFYVVFGNGEIRFKLNQFDMELNIGHNFKSFETGAHKNGKVFTGKENEIVQMESYEIYRIFLEEK